MHLTKSTCEICHKIRGLGSNHDKCSRIKQQRGGRKETNATAVNKRLAIKIQAHVVEYVRTGTASEFLKQHLTEARLNELLTK